jgi:hypothetical protein
LLQGGHFHICEENKLRSLYIGNQTLSFSLGLEMAPWDIPHFTAIAATQSEIDGFQLSKQSSRRLKNRANVAARQFRPVTESNPISPQDRRTLS